MVLFTIFCPIVAAVLIMLGAHARKTALAASVLTFAAALLLFASLDHGHADFQHVTSFSISPEWRLSFTTGVDGLSVIMVLLATIVTLAALWFTGTVEKYENAFYACLLFISGGAIGAFASIDLFFFYAFHELALIPTFLLIGIWGSGNGSDRSGRTTACLSAAAYRFRNSHLALSVSHLGARSVCRSAGACCNAARRRLEEIRAVRFLAPGHSNAARRRPSLGDPARRAIAR